MECKSVRCQDLLQSCFLIDVNPASQLAEPIHGSNAVQPAKTVRMWCQAYSLVAKLLKEDCVHKSSPTPVVDASTYAVSIGADVLQLNLCDSNNSLHVLFSTGQAWAHCLSCRSMLQAEESSLLDQF